MRRFLDQARVSTTITTSETAMLARTRTRSIIALSASEDPALIELRHHKTKGAEVEARIQRHHRRNRHADHPADYRVAPQNQAGRHQPERPADRAGDATGFMVFVDVVAFEDARRLQDAPDQ